MSTCVPRSFSGVFITTSLAVLALFIQSASAQTCTVGTYAGTGSSGFSGDGGNAANAMFTLSSFGGVWVDTSQKLFIADYTNSRVRVVDSGTKVISTIAGSSLTSYSGEGVKATSAGVDNPTGVCIDTSGTMYIPTSLYRVHKVDPSGIITTFVGTGTAGYSGDGGKATSGRLNDPRNCVLDSSGNVYLSDTTNYAVRVVTVSSKIITTFAGTKANSNYFGDGGPATSAGMYPLSIFMDSTGNLYLTDYNGYRVRKIAAGTKIITTFAGTGVNTMTGMGGPATSATFKGGAAYVVGDKSGNVYIGNDYRLFRVDGTSNHLIDVYAGTGNAGSTDAACASAKFAPLNQIAIFNGDTTNSIYVPTTANNVRRVLLQFAPTATPTLSPSIKPSVVPTQKPSLAPSKVPTLCPTAAPSQVPTLCPSAAPSDEPTMAPGSTIAPSLVPSLPPAAGPSQMPTLIPSASPSFSPSCVPSAAPSQGPSTSPTAAPVPLTEVPSQTPMQAPTAAPGTIAPTVAPSETPSQVPSQLLSVMPTIQPTQTLKPTAAFSVKPSPQITAPPTASFDGIAVDQSVAIKFVRKGAVTDGRRLSRDQLDDSSRNALIGAAASVMGLAVSAVSIVDEYLVDTNSTTGLSRIAVTFRFLVQNSDFPQQNFPSPKALFIFLTTAFAQSVSGAAFDTAMKAAAVQYQAAELLEHDAQLDSTVTIAPPTFTEVDTYDPMDAGLSTGEYAGVVIGVLVAFIVLGAIVFLLFNRRSEESAQSAVSTSQV